MSAGASRARYSAAMRWLHWTMFALVALAYLFINIVHQFPRGSEARANVMASHFLAGVAVLLLVVPRIWARLAGGQPPISPPPPRWEDVLARLTHLLLYLFLLVQPLLGVLTLQIEGHDITIFGVTVLPSFVANPDRALAHQFEHIHETIGTVFYWIIGLHILAALWHHYGRRDDTLRRMG